MPNGNGHWHLFKAMPVDVAIGISYDNQGCAFCCGMRDERVHQPPAGVTASSGLHKPTGLLAKCPDCGASLGQKCFNKSTHRSLSTVHRSRVAAQRRMYGT